MPTRPPDASPTRLAAPARAGEAPGPWADEDRPPLPGPGQLAVMEAEARAVVVAEAEAAARTARAARRDVAAALEAEGAHREAMRDAHRAAYTHWPPQLQAAAEVIATAGRCGWPGVGRDASRPHGWHADRVVGRDGRQRVLRVGVAGRAGEPAAVWLQLGPARGGPPDPHAPGTTDDADGPRLSLLPYLLAALLLYGLRHLWGEGPRPVLLSPWAAVPLGLLLACGAAALRSTGPETGGSAAGRSGRRGDVSWADDPGDWERVAGAVRRCWAWHASGADSRRAHELAHADLQAVAATVVAAAHAARSWLANAQGRARRGLGSDERHPTE